MMQGLRTLALSGVAALGLAAGPAAAQEELKIGMVNLSLCCAYFVGMDAAVKDEATHFSNVTILSTDAGGDVAKLTEDVEDLLNQGAKALIVSGAWIEAAPAALEAIEQAGRAGGHGRPAAQGRRVHQLGRPGQPRHRRGHRQPTSPSASAARARS